MSTTTYLRQMCHDLLSQADINAIGKARGFTATELSSRAALENYYLSPVGVAQAMAKLTPDEVVMLHFLHLRQEAAAINLFERLYPSGRSAGYWTYSQRYQPVFKEVRDRLVRRGLLIMGQDVLGGETKMAQWRFVLPPEFLPYLPSPLKTAQLAGPGDVQRDVPRAKLVALLGQSKAPGSTLLGYTLTLENGRLLTDVRPFRAADLTEWQKAAWRTLLPKRPKEKFPPTPSQDIPLLDALTYWLRLLPPDEWIAPDQLDAPLSLFIGYPAQSEEVCHLGWQWGYLARQGENGRYHYRLADLDPTDETALAPDDYLTVINDHTVRVNLHTIPYLALEQLNQMAHFTLTDELYAVPNLVRTGEALSLRSAPLVQWLIQHAPAFATTWQTAQKRWGKQIVHSNLMIACVTDLTLRVQLERGLKSDEFIVLADEYVAFPPKAINKVKRIVEQAGHVIKYYEA
ncbi:MAG: hypothetical protein IPM39_02445 [Chloroflexi bacterium]|nr:hypothetical protein [Chloroflexota bacterium]